MTISPTVSVIIPVYNRAATINRAIQSVLAQTFEDYEIIVVDDGSADQTHQIVQGIKDRRLKLIHHERNKGASAARNTGMRAASGKYIAWLDSDDEWFPPKIEAQLDALRKASDDVKACYTAYERVDKDRTVFYVPRTNETRKLYLTCDLGPGTTLMFERAVLDKIGFIDETLNRYEDAEWLLRYSAHYRLIGVDQPLARIYDLSRPSAEEVESSARAYIAKISPGLRSYGIFRRVAISWRWMDVASYFALEHKPGKMLQYLLKAICVYPFQPPEAWAWLINNWFDVKIGQWFFKWTGKTIKKL
jgi:glycosyltransferase involved in cell wall biosynthesis